MGCSEKKFYSISLVKALLYAFFAVLLASVALEFYSNEAYADNKNENIKVNCFKHGDVDANYQVQLTYNDEGFFTLPSNVYSNELAYASACLAYASIGASQSDWKKGPDNLKNFLDEVGCGDYSFNIGYTNLPTEKSNIGVGIGTKTITIEGQEYKLFIIGIRGANYFKEWALNLRVGNEGEHAGFTEARDTVLSFILPYIKSHTSNGDKIKIWCSGNSRAGSVTNLVGGWLNKWAYERNNNTVEYSTSYNAEHSVYGKTYNAQSMKNEEKEFFPCDYLDSSIQLRNEDIYFYPMCPGSGALKDEVNKYKDIMGGIHSLINPDDFTPLVPPSQWGFSRYGSDHDITGTYGITDSFDSRERSMVAFNQLRIQQMLANLKKLNPAIGYTNPWFQQYYISHWWGLSKDNRGEGNYYIDKDKSLNNNFGRYCLELLEFLTDAGELKTRQAYVAKLEDSISYVMGLYFGLNATEKSDLAKSIKRNLSTQIGIAIGDSSFNIEKPGSSFLRFINDVLRANNSLKLRGVLFNTLRPALSQANVSFDENAVSKLADDFSQLLNKLCLKDTKNLFHITTAGKSIDMFEQGHVPEVNIAWWAASGVNPSTDPSSTEKKHIKLHSKPYGQGNEGDPLILEFDIAKGQERMISSEPAPKDSDGKSIDTGVLYYEKPKAAGYILDGWEIYPTVDPYGYYNDVSRIHYSRLPDENEVDLYPDMSDLAIYGIEYHANRPDNDDTDTIYSEANEESLFVEDRGFERPDYEFTGWNTKRDGSGQSFKANEDTQLSALGLMSTQAYHEAIGTEGNPDRLDQLVTQNTKVLYAQWKRTTPPAAPVIQTQPKDLTWTMGDKTARSLSVTVTSPDGGTLSYQWYEDGKKIEGATKNVLSIDRPEKRAAGTYRFSCVVLNTIDGLGSATTSHTATVVVKPTAKAPVIQAQPNDLTWTKGDKTSRWLEVSAYAPDKGTISYQWYKNGKAIKGATSNTYVIPNPEKHVVGKTVYYCEITNTLEDTKNTVTSRKAAVVVTAVAAAPVIKKQPVNVVWTIGDKTSRSLQVIAVSPDNGKLSYQWYENGQAIQGATSNTYVIPTPEKRGVGKSVYYCVVTNTLDGVKKAVSTQKVTATVKQKAASAVFVPRLKMTSSKANALKLTWNKNANAQGYDVFFGKVTNVKKAITYKKIKTIKGNKTVSFTKTKLAKQTAYAAYVKAYKVVKGKKVYLPATPAVVALTSNGNKTYTNAKAVTVQTSSITLSKGKTFQIKPRVTVITPKKKVMTTKTIPFMRYYTNNPKIVKVSKTGKVKAVGKGSCTLYAVASNGVSKALKVTVK